MTLYVSLFCNKTLKLGNSRIKYINEWTKDLQLIESERWPLACV